MKRFASWVALALAIISCKADDGKKTSPGFAFGADTSWYTQMKAENLNTVYDSEGVPASVPDLIASYGFDSVRLRLWVNPENDMSQTGGFCGLDDVLAKARKATELGQRVMIDFQYSDTWADAGNQQIPAAWAGLTTPASLAAKVYDYTLSVMTAMKQAEVNVVWAQLGNETSNGMLFDYGKFAIDNVTSPSRVDNFIAFFNAGAKAAREIYPEVSTVCHLNNGYDYDMYRWFFGEIAKRPTPLDADYIGMSLYPIPCLEWDEGNPDFCRTSSWRARTDKALQAIPSLYEAFGKRFLVCETGFPNLWTLSAPGGAEASASEMERRCNSDATEFLDYFVGRLQETGLCDGIFYWEPECNYFHDYSMGALTSANRPNAVWDYVRDHSLFAGYAEVIHDDGVNDIITVSDGIILINGIPAESARAYTPDGRAASPSSPGLYIITAKECKPTKIIIR